MEMIPFQQLDRKKLQQEGYDFVFKYYIYKRNNKEEDWKLQPGNIISYEEEGYEQELEKKELTAIILIPFKKTEEGFLNKIKLDEDWVPVKESDCVITLDILKKYPNLEIWKS